jgi:hypothetical protein
VTLGRRSFLAWLALSAAARAQNATPGYDWQGVSRVVAIGDVHGDKDALASVLRLAGLIDANERWSGGAAHVVQVGDVPARGTQTRQAFDLLMRLQAEALAAGGRVHALIGNHEAGAMNGDPRNVLPEEFAAFRTADSGKRLQAAYDREVAALRRRGEWPATAAARDAFRASWFESHPPGWAEHREAFAPAGTYGSWIRRNNAIVRVNDTLFVHGGISPKYAATPPQTINDTIRRELAQPPGSAVPLWDEVAGPLRYRGLAEDDDRAPDAHVDRVLAAQNVRRIVIGHTVTQTAILPRYQARVVNVDLGLSRFYGRPPACLVLEGRSAYVWHRQTKIEFPEPGAADHTAYLKAVIAADDQPSPVSRLLSGTAADSGK